MSDIEENTAQDSRTDAEPAAGSQFWDFRNKTAWNWLELTSIVDIYCARSVAALAFAVTLAGCITSIPCTESCEAEFAVPAGGEETMVATPRQSFRFEIRPVKTPATTEITAVTMERFSDRGNSWQQLKSTQTLHGGQSDLAENSVGLEVFELSSGPILIRAELTDSHGITYQTPPRGVNLSHLPVPHGRIYKRPGADGGVDVTLDGSKSTDGKGQETSITTWQWDFGDGVSATGKKVTHNYAAAGSYMVILCITDSNGLVAYKYYQLDIDEDDDDPRDTPPPTIFGEELDEWGDCKALSMTVARTQGGQFSHKYATKTKASLGMNNTFATTTVDVDFRYGFEVITQIEGNPGKCYEWQQLKRTSITNALTRPFRGAAIGGKPGRDNLRDGNIPTGLAEFPAMGAGFGLDGYTSPNHAKVHVPGFIKWRDSPGLTTNKKAWAHNYRYTGEFVTFVGGVKGDGSPASGNRDLSREASCHFWVTLEVSSAGMTRFGLMMPVNDQFHRNCTYK